MIPIGDVRRLEHQRRQARELADRLAPLASRLRYARDAEGQRLYWEALSIWTRAGCLKAEVNRRLKAGRAERRRKRTAA